MLAANMHTTLEQLQSGIEKHLAGLDATAMQQRPDSEHWSIQQIMEHLLLTYGLTAANFEARIAKGKATGAHPSLKDRMSQFYVCTLGRFPKGREAPGITVPSSVSEPVSGEALSRQTRTALERFDGVADKAEHLFGQQPAITHPVLGPMGVTNWRRFHLVHGEHHLRHIAALRPTASS